MKRDLPIFDIVLNDEDLKQGVGMISLVDDPAIGVNWIALKKQPNFILAKKAPKFLLAKKAPKFLLAKRECFGCPPNGDGKRKDGQPDRRCSDGTKKTPDKKSPKSKSSDTDKDKAPKDNKEQAVDKISNAEKIGSGWHEGLYVSKPTMRSEMSVEESKDLENSINSKTRTVEKIDDDNFTEGSDYYVTQYGDLGNEGDIYKNWSFEVRNGFPDYYDPYGGKVIGKRYKTKNGTFKWDIYEDEYDDFIKGIRK